jgi:hypothetical protein
MTMDDVGCTSNQWYKQSMKLLLAVQNILLSGQIRLVCHVHSDTSLMHQLVLSHNTS